MKQSGRANLLLLLALVGAVAVIFLLFFGQESLSSVGARFMTALAKGDVDTLTKLSDMGSEPEAQVRKEWEFAVNTAGKHYRFIWKISSSAQADANSGSVRLQVSRNADQPGTYEENFQLPMLKVGSDWKVDVRGISREMYPGLPR